MFQKIISNEEQNAGKAPHVPNRPAPTPQPAAAAPESAPPRQPVASSSSPQTGHKNRLSNDVEIKGSIRFKDELLVDGKVEGEITSTGSLSIQENARIRAEVRVGSVIVEGKVHGNITATQTVELRAGSEVVGDIKAAVLTMEAGAIFVGKSEVGAPTSQPTQSGQPKQSGQSSNKGNQPSSSNKGGGNQNSSKSDSSNSNGSSKQGDLAKASS
jgi:cytoskeletal protein CcmA (bactofilin family)